MEGFLRFKGSATATSHFFVLKRAIVGVFGSSAGDDQPGSGVLIEGGDGNSFQGVTASADSIVAALGGHVTDLS